jgi:release factor glutamine methyltransferase
MDRSEVVTALERGGFVAAEEEADELLACGGDVRDLLARRLTGEPLAWITGSTRFCGIEVAVLPGVYVPRWHTELIAEAALARLPEGGLAIDLCTGCGAIARVLSARGRVVAGDRDPAAVACARANGVDAHVADLFAGLPEVTADVIVAVVPYVPTPELPLLQRDTLTFESPLAYDGGPDGLDLLRRVVAEAPAWLRPGGSLVLELGGDQASALDLSAFTDVTILTDEDGDTRGVAGSRSESWGP